MNEKCTDYGPFGKKHRTNLFKAGMKIEFVSQKRNHVFLIKFTSRSAYKLRLHNTSLAANRAVPNGSYR